MAHHVSHREDEPFRAIADGRKTIESRLYDEKRRSYELGDTVKLVNRTTEEAVVVRIVGLLRYMSFKEMFVRNNPARFGGESAAWLLRQIRQFYSEEDERKYGVLGIEFEVLTSP